MYLKQIELGGEKYPVHFGMNALLLISEEIGIQSDDLMAALGIRTQNERLVVAHIGFMEGARLAGHQFPDVLVDFCDLLDTRPEALAEAIGLYYLQTFGKGMDELFAKAESTDDEAAKESIQQLKNVWPTLTQAASLLPSADYKK